MMRLTCPLKGTSKAPLRTPTCESGFRNKKIGRHLRVFFTRNNNNTTNDPPNCYGQAFGLT
ncbi:hypothetical protein J2TS4_31000 [Paenibacillus sp. J2TS4]|nr:hypothetical protein J2TS4_31000 [Paenibacillus sp. J2TS4]